MAKKLIAYCWASGLIEFGADVPDGAIAIAAGTSKLVRTNIAATARLSYDNKTLLVPGVPEAPSQHDAANALGAHLSWLKRRERSGFRIAAMRAADS